MILAKPFSDFLSFRNPVSTEPHLPKQVRHSAFKMSFNFMICTKNYHAGTHTHSHAHAHALTSSSLPGKQKIVIRFEGKKKLRPNLTRCRTTLTKRKKEKMNKGLDDKMTKLLKDKMI